MRRGEAKGSPALPQLYKMAVALGAYFLDHDEMDARRGPSATLLAGVPLPVLERVGAELMAVDDPVFWELTDRVVNFDYVEAERPRSACRPCSR